MGDPRALFALGDRGLARCASIDDIRRLARRRVPPAVFDYVDGAAGTETTLRRSRAAFERVEFIPRVLRDVSSIDLSTSLLGGRSSLPFALAPTGFTRMMHHIGEPAVAAGASTFDIPYALSTLGTTSIEELASSVPTARRWFQLYVSTDRAAAEDLMSRASARGFEALILTVDTAVGGIRRREVRRGLTIPPELTLKTLGQMALYPRWWANLLTTRPLEFASLSSTQGSVGDLLTRVLDPKITFEDIAWLRSNWSGPIMVKGVQSLDDARTLAELGVEALVLSNHGGRQVDMGGAPLELLPTVVAALGGQVEIWIDGGIMSGMDIVAALCLGASGTLIGRAYLYGLMAGGEAGVERSIEILAKEIKTTMQLIGASSVHDLNPDLVRIRTFTP